MEKKASFLAVYGFVFFILFSTTWATGCKNYYGYNVQCTYGCCDGYCCSETETDINWHFTGLSVAAIAGIIIGVIFVLSVIVTLIRYCCCSQNRPGRVVNNVAQPSVSVVTTGMEQQMAPGMQMQMQHPPPGYIPQAPSMSAGYPGHPDTKGPPPPY